MAKVPFSKLNVKINGSDCKCSYNDGEDDVWYEVRHYLPLKEKIEMIERIINQSVDENGFYSPMKVKLYMVLEIMYAYTNLSFSAKMKEDPYKLYDLVVSTGIFADVISSIRENDWSEIKENVWATIDNIYKYNNSAMGSLERISADYSNLNLDVLKFKEELSDPESLGLLRDIVTKLG